MSTFKSKVDFIAAVSSKLDPTQTSQDVRSALISGISSADDVVRSQVTGSKSLALNLKIGTWVIRDDDLPLFRALSTTGAGQVQRRHDDVSVERIPGCIQRSNQDKPGIRVHPEDRTGYPLAVKSWLPFWRFPAPSVMNCAGLQSFQAVRPEHGQTCPSPRSVRKPHWRV